MRGLSNLIPFQGESIGSQKIRKILTFTLIIGLLQAFSWTFQIVEPPLASATTYTPTGYPTGSIWTVPSGVDTITFTALGGGAGRGGLDGAGATIRYPGPRGYVVGSLRLNAGAEIGIYPGRAGANGVTGSNNGGGAGGIGTYPTVNYSGGNGANAGSVGGSGGGGGGGAASVLTVGGVIYAVAGGAGGAGGSANFANSGEDGQSTNALNTGVNGGGAGTQTSTSNAGAGKACTISTNDGGGGGGGGGGSFGGSGGGLQNAGTGECSGRGGYRGNNFLISNAALSNTTNSTDPNASNSNNALEGSITVRANLSVPTSITTSGSTQSFTVSWATAAAAQSFSLKIYNAAGNSLLQTVPVASGTYTKTVTSADFASIATLTTYQVSVTAIGNSGAPYIDSAESAKVAVTTSTPSDMDSAISLNGTNQFASASGAQVIPASTASAFTVQAWIRQPASRSSGTLYQILSQGASSSQFYLKVFNGSVIFSRSGYTSENTCAVGLSTEEWTHVAVVVGNTSQSCYINGSLAGSFTQSSTTAIGTTFAVGQYTPLGGEFFLGQIDEVKIWSDARTQVEIQSDLKSYGGTLADNLVAYYNFNELVGNRVLNRSTGGSSAFDLTTANSPTITSTSIIETSTVQAYTVVKFMRTFLVASGGWTSPATPKRIKYLVVGGGGGGGINVGGGGAGGGGYKVTNQTPLTSSIINITVGVGGVGGLFSYNGTALVDGQSGGSSSVTVGATTYVGTGGSGGETYWGSNFCGGSGAVSAYSTAGSFTGSGGVGFTGGLGGSPSNSQSTANGKTGFIDSITGTAQHYGSGGGAGEWPGGGMVRGLGVNSISGNGGSLGVVGSNAVTNTGAGGGAGGGNCSNGGNGASGVVVLAYITNDPSITTQPTNDTTTVGTVDTFTITTTTLPAPLTKLVNWQVATDTTTATASVSWQNVTLGTGLNTDTYTTQTLTLGMNKYRYRAIVTFTDVDSLTVIETSTVAILTINPAITITSDTATITRKYGDSQTVRTLVYSGGTTSTGAIGTTTSHTVRGSFGTQASGRIVLDTSTTTAVFRVDTATVVGSYVETITVTDAKGATATYTQRVVVNPADTLTVQADTLTAITFGATLNPTVTVTGLRNGDTVASATFGSVSCANGGLCAIGDIGPGGGVVFHLITNMSDSQTAIAGYTSGGIYLEAAPVGWGNGIAVSAGETTGTAYLDPVVKWCNTNSNLNGSQPGIGRGGLNTKNMDTNCSSGAGKIAANWVSPSGLNDWYLPSRNELEKMADQKNLIGLIYGLNNCYNSTCYWSSTDNGGSTALAFEINVGTNFERTNNKALGVNEQLMMRPIRAFSPIINNTETVTAGVPTAAGTYSLRPTAITLANSVNTNNYAAIIYRSSPVTINRAFENPRISMQPAKVAYDTGTATQALTATSGAGTGAIFYMIGAGSAAGCSISGSTVRSTSDGVCNVIAFKQASTNYFADSATAVAITFTRFVERQLQVQLYPSMIPLNQGNALETTTVTSSTLTISSVTRTSAGAYTITGTGFTNIELVSIGGTALTGSNYTRTSDTTLTLSGVSSFVGPLLIRLSDGQESVVFRFVWS